MENNIKKTVMSFFLYLCAATSLFCEGKEDEKIWCIAKQLGTLNEGSIYIERLSGGLTNYNYKVSLGASSYFFRCTNQNSDILGSSLDREWQITNKISEEKIAPQIVLYLAEDGVIVTNFIEAIGGKVDLRDKESLQKFCHLISSVHNLNLEFPTQFCPFETIRNYTENALELGLVLPFFLENSILPWIDFLRKSQFLTMKVEKKPAHLDLWSGNILDDGKQLWLIDWEYSAMGDPFFDLATLTSVENFSDDEMYEFLQCYLARDPNKEEFNHFYSMRILADIRWALWAYIQTKLSTLDEPFEDMGNEYFRHALKRIGTSS